MHKSHKILRTIYKLGEGYIVIPTDEREIHGFVQTNGSATFKQSKKNGTLHEVDDGYDTITVVNTTKVRVPKKKQVRKI